jgi:hypothetical protein
MHGSNLRRWVASAMAASLLLWPGPTSFAQSATGCAPGQTPGFRAGFAALKGQIGQPVGNPTTCEYPDPNATGDVEQNTTMGLAFWRKSTNTPTFTNGFEHWALTSDGEVYWTGTPIDPPFRPFVGRWTRRDVSLVVLGNGSASVNWRTGVCSMSNPPPCDDFTPQGDRILGGNAELILTNATTVFLTAGSSAAPVLEGQVTSSTQQETAPIEWRVPGAVPSGRRDPTRRKSLRPRRTFCACNKRQ